MPTKEQAIAAAVRLQGRLEAKRLNTGRNDPAQAALALANAQAALRRGVQSPPEYQNPPVPFGPKGEAA